MLAVLRGRKTFELGSLDKVLDFLSGEQMTKTGGRLARGILVPVAAILVFFVYALQCFSTVAVLRRETNSWKWPAISWTYMFVLAWVAAYLGHTITAAVTG